MPDRERVIEGLTAMREFFGFGLPSQSLVFEAYQNILTDALALLKEHPQIVRCKDCRWWNNGVCENDDLSRRINDCGCYPDFMTDSNWFCADGEVKEE